MAFNVFQLRYSWDCEIVTRTLTINYSLTKYVSAVDLDLTTWTRSKLKWQHINKQQTTSNKIKHRKITPPSPPQKGLSCDLLKAFFFLRPKGSTQLIQVSKRAKCAGNKIFQNLSWKDSRTRREGEPPWTNPNHMGDGWVDTYNPVDMCSWEDDIFSEVKLFILNLYTVEIRCYPNKKQVASSSKCSSWSLWNRENLRMPRQWFSEPREKSHSIKIAPKKL